MKNLFITFSILFSIISYSQTKTEESELYYKVESVAKFPGGNDDALEEFLSEEVKNSKITKKKKLSGSVYISFTVDKEGNVVNIKEFSERNLNLNKKLIKEGLKIVAKMPKWKPAEQRGKKVQSTYVIPIVFK